MFFYRFYVGSKYPYFISYRGKWLYLFCHGCIISIELLSWKAALFIILQYANLNCSFSDWKINGSLQKILCQPKVSKWAHFHSLSEFNLTIRCTIYHLIQVLPSDEVGKLNHNQGLQHFLDTQTFSFWFPFMKQIPLSEWKLSIPIFLFFILTKIFF